MKSRVTAVLSIFIASALATGAYAESDGHGPRGHFDGPGGDIPSPERMLERMTKRLDLDDTQQQEVRNILSAAKPEIDVLRERGMANREAMQALEANDADRSAAVNNIAIEKGQLVTEGTLLRERIRNDIGTVLTDEQREKLSSSLERWGDRKNRRHKRGRRSHDQDETSEQ